MPASPFRSVGSPPNAQADLRGQTGVPTERHRQSTPLKRLCPVLRCGSPQIQLEPRFRPRQSLVNAYTRQPLPICGLTLTRRPGPDRKGNRADAPLSRADADEGTRVVVGKERIERWFRTLLRGRGSDERDNQNPKQNQSGSHYVASQ